MKDFIKNYEFRPLHLLIAAFLSTLSSAIISSFVIMHLGPLIAWLIIFGVIVLIAGLATLAGLERL